MQNVLKVNKQTLKESLDLYHQTCEFPDVSTLLSFFCDRTKIYISHIDKSLRKQYGQFFTSFNIAAFMANLIETQKKTINVLDPGAGSGILTAALLDRLKIIESTKHINIDLYETDTGVLPLLYSNMEYAKKQLANENITLNYRIINENFIISNKEVWNPNNKDNEKYDIVISNPPYLKISVTAEEALIMKDIVYGQPNLYFLFMALAAKLTKQDGENIFIVPRSFSNGLYFSAFRKWYFDNIKLCNIHLFNSRNNVFKMEKVLQETLILKGKKSTKNIDTISISSSENSDSINKIKPLKVNRDICINTYNILFIPSSTYDVSTLNFVQKWTSNLIANGYKVKTGSVVDFREKDLLSHCNNKSTIPLIWAYNFENGIISFPKKIDNKPQFLIDNATSKRLQLKNSNYVFIKRFSSKEEKRRIQCAILNKETFKNYDNISAENHINVLCKENSSITNEELKGLFILFNSNIIDNYFRLFNGSTQVNAGDLNQMPFPTNNEIIKLGQNFDNISNLTPEICDKLIYEQFL